MAQVSERAAVVSLTDLARTGIRRTSAADAPRPLRLNLLGGFTVTVGDDIVELPTGTQRLVAYLALRGRTSRSRVAGTLWPDTTEKKALASLRTCIWRVNQTADWLLTAPSGTVDVGSTVLVDVRRLIDSGLSSLRTAMAVPVPVGGVFVEDVEKVLEEEGELLPDWEDEWLLADRERLRQLRLHILETMAERLSLAGRYGLALEAALGALRADSLRESAHRTVIGIHLAEGNVAEARRAYEECRCLLVNDLGVEPSPALTCLLQPAVTAGMTGAG